MAEDDARTITVTALWKLNLVSSILLGLSALLSVWIILPHRVDSIETRLDRMEKTQVQWVELLIRIDERVERMAVEQERLRESERESNSP